MLIILGPYVYNTGGAVTTTAQSSTLTDVLSWDDPAYAKLMDTKGKTLGYLDLRKILTFDASTQSMLGLTVEAFLTTWYGASSNQMGLLARYSNADVRDTTDVFAAGFVRAFNPLIDAELTLSAVSINKPDTLTPYRSYEMSDLVISGARDLSNTLVFVNGVCHNTIFWNKAQYVIDGMYNIRQQGAFDIQCYDTTPVGGHTVVPITPDMCVWDADKAGIIITLPTGSTFTGKSVLNTVDGYLFYPGEVLQIVSPTQAFLHTCKIPFISQWRHNPLTKKTDDIIGRNWAWDKPSAPDMQTPPVITGDYRSINQQSDLELFVNTRSVPYADVSTPEFQYNRVTSPHSALILINAPNLSHQVITPYTVPVLSRYGYPQGTFPTGISRYGVGLSPSYTVLSGGLDQTWLYVEPQDMDMDRQNHVLNPDCVTQIYPELERSMDLPFTVHILS